ncbi:hypothetical protein I3W98_35800, partial [Streptomyces cavourensis]|nr:hypothetical protein [Streptomyces cavourensis]
MRSLRWLRRRLLPAPGRHRTLQIGPALRVVLTTRLPLWRGGGGRSTRLGPRVTCLDSGVVRCAGRGLVRRSGVGVVRCSRLGVLGRARLGLRRERLPAVLRSGRRAGLRGIGLVRGLRCARLSDRLISPVRRLRLAGVGGLSGHRLTRVALLTGVAGVRLLVGQAGAGLLGEQVTCGSLKTKTGKPCRNP